MCIHYIKKSIDKYSFLLFLSQSLESCLFFTPISATVLCSYMFLYNHVITLSHLSF